MIFREKKITFTMFSKMCRLVLKVTYVSRLMRKRPLAPGPVRGRPAGRRLPGGCYGRCPPSLTRRSETRPPVGCGDRNLWGVRRIILLNGIFFIIIISMKISSMKSILTFSNKHVFIRLAQYQWLLSRKCASGADPGFSFREVQKIICTQRT